MSALDRRSTRMSLRAYALTREDSWEREEGKVSGVLDGRLLERVSLTAWIARHMRHWPCAFGVGFEGAAMSGACVAMGSKPPGSPQERGLPARPTRGSHAREQMSLGL